MADSGVVTVALCEQYSIATRTWRALEIGGAPAIAGHCGAADPTTGTLYMFGGLRRGERDGYRVRKPPRPLTHRRSTYTLRCPSPQRCDAARSNAFLGNVFYLRVCVCHSVGVALW